MPTPTTNARLPLIVRRALNPPIRELPFWTIQAIILAIVGLHYFIDIQTTFMRGAFPTGLPVALLVVPIGYAALRYGIAGSLATTFWALLLWLPDLLLPNDQGHVGEDVMNLAIVVLVAFIFGQRVEAERLTQARIEEAAALTLAVEVGYRHLFESNRAPILVLDEDGAVSDANPAAKELLGADLLGSSAVAFLGTAEVEQLSGTVFTLANGHDYRLDVVSMPPETNLQRRQLNFEDVTEERSEERRTRHFAQHIVQVEEDQRRRLARELHDEPLQLFLHLARRLEILGNTGGVPSDVASGLNEARNQALDAAARLRTLARDLRPPALDQLGLVAALSSLVADIEDDLGVSAQLTVIGSAVRLAPDVELGAFRIIQESLRNAVRHADPRHLQVTVEFSPRSLCLDVRDDGRGFDPTKVRQLSTESQSLGLVGMQERAKLLGGTLEVRSTIGQGTLVQAVLPVSAPATPLGAHAN
jgi:signal transduction histidine kinase